MTDDETEAAVRTQICPSCRVGPGQRCAWPVEANNTQRYSHTSRYNAAAEAGLVPALRPIPTQECTCH